MTEHLKKLLADAKKIPFTPADKEAQRRSFAYGNTNIENPRITREMVNDEAEKLAATKA